MNIGITAQELTVATLLGPGASFVTPPYQRSYSWGEREAMALFSDLWEATENDAIHFIGAIVVVQRADTDSHEIVDGQQRLTTLTILLAILRDLESDAARAGRLNETISVPARPDLGEPTGWRLRLNNMDGAFFRSAIQAHGRAALIEGEVIGDSESQQRLSQVAAAFLREIRGLSGEERRALAETTLKRCVMARVSVADRDMGYKVFRILHTRGKDPNAHDIVKTELFERARFDVQEANRYAAIWKENEALIGGTAFDDLLRQIRMLHDRSAKGDLVTGIRRTVFPRTDARRFLDEQLPAYVRAYQEISTGHVGLDEASEKVGDYLNRMRALDHLGWRAPALKFLVEHRHRGDIASDFFRLLERLAYMLQLIISKKDQRDKRYRKVIDALEPGDTLNGLLGESGPFAITRDESRKLRERLLGRFATFGQRRAMALRLNAALDGGQTLPPESDATVEHVLPRNPDPRSFWLTVWPDPARRRELCDTLGNFILLTHEDNQRADRLDFRDKKKVYFDAAATPFALNRDLAQQDAWTAEVVRQRTERLADILARDWGLLDP